MKHVEPGSYMNGPGNLCHSVTSMQYISNQDQGGYADDWLDWWEKNKTKSQEQWIAEGFEQHGVKVNIPPTEEQRPRLLVLLNKSDPNNTSTFDGLKYNAFRCLRDSGFDPVEYAISNPKMSDEIKRGLREYERLERRFPAVLGLGILPFAKQEVDLDSYGTSGLLTTQFQVIAYTSSIGSLLLRRAHCLVTSEKENSFLFS